LLSWLNAFDNPIINIELVLKYTSKMQLNQPLFIPEKA